MRSAGEIHGGGTPSGGGFDTARVGDEVKTTFDRLVGRSPVGVLRSLEKAAESDQLAALISMLPPDLLSIYRQPLAKRASAMGMTT